jgi:single-strand DNA-binding protein
MEIIGRVTADAKVKVLPDEREVVNFSIAVNDSYKPKGIKEVKKVVTYIDCSYWLSTNIAQYIKKGVVIQLSGSISARAWIDSSNEAKAGLNFQPQTLVNILSTSLTRVSASLAAPCALQNSLKSFSICFKFDKASSMLIMSEILG